MNIKSGSIYIYIAAMLAILATVPGRLAYGIIIAIEMNIVMIAATSISKLLYVLDLEEFRDFLMMIAIIFVVVFFKQLLILFSPLLAMTLGYVLFLPALSTFVIGSLKIGNNTFITILKRNIYNTLVFSSLCIVFFLLRDVLGYGTITLPSTMPLGFFSIRLLVSSSILPATFWATIPGALVLSAIMLWLLSFCRKHIYILRRSYEYGEGDVV